MKCSYCNCSCIKAGLQKNGSQKFYCKRCNRYQQEKYLRKAWQANTQSSICALLKEGMSIRGISRILNIALSTVISRIKQAGSRLVRPIRNDWGHVYEIDELWTFVGKKANELWLMYSYNRNTREVLDFKVGARTRENLKQITDRVVQQQPKKICTDGLKVYPGLIPRAMHKVGSMNTCHIERFNLNLRTHLKRLSRKTICFSKSKEMLEACLRIYFWGTRSTAMCI